MHALLDLPDAEGPEVGDSPLTARMIRHRFWVYLALFLLAIALIAVDQRATSSAAPARAAQSPPHSAPSR
jgi:hypothetical protein